MIFVTLGNQNFQFNRLIEKVEDLVKNGVIDKEVIAQTGHTHFQSEVIKTIDFLSKREFNEYIERSEYVISHAGTGSLINCLRRGKVVIAGARLNKYEEHIDDHQVEILEAFSSQSFILALNADLSNLEEKVNNIKSFVPEKFVSNNDLFNKGLIKIIENLGSDQ